MTKRLSAAIVVGSLLHAQPEPTFRSSARLVQITVVAQDTRHHPITDLRKEDFAITEDSHVLRLAGFSANRSAQSSNPDPGLGRWSNRPDQGKTSASHLILLDLAHTSAFDWAWASKHIANYLSGVQREDRIAVYAIDGRGLHVLQNFDDDPTFFLSKLHGQSLPEVEGIANDKPSASTPPSAFSSRDDTLPAPRLFSFGFNSSQLAALLMIAEHVAAVPGRKSLIWMSGEFPTFPINTPQSQAGEPRRSGMADFVRRIVNSDLSIYPVDLHGLRPGAGFEIGNGFIENRLPGQRQQSFPDIEELAVRTGGQAYYNFNGIEKSIRDVIAKDQGSYTLSFIPPETSAVKGFHRVKVSISRSGAHLTYRPGYWDPSDRVGEQAGVDTDLRTALDSPFPSTSIGLQADVYRVTNDAREAVLTIAVNPADLALRHNGSQWSGELDAIFAQKDGQGRVFAIPAFHRRLAFSDQQYTVLRHDWLYIRCRLLIRNQSTILRAAIRDGVSGALGSLDIPTAEIHESLPSKQ